MKSLDEEIFVCVDCESTGLDPKADRIIEVAAVVFTFNGILDRFDTLVNPGQAISPESQKIHNISDAMVADAPPVKAILPDLIKFLASHPIVGHGIGFDIDLIKAEAERYNIFCPIEQSTQIDTLRLARAYGNCPSNSLSNLGKHFNAHTEGAHRAMNDVVMNVEVFKHLCKDYKHLKHILKVLSKPVALRAMPLGKHKGRPFREIPEPYLRWCLSKDFDQDLTFSIRSELKRRRKGTNFNSAGNPFSGL